MITRIIKEEIEYADYEVVDGSTGIYNYMVIPLKCSACNKIYGLTHIYRTVGCVQIVIGVLKIILFQKIDEEYTTPNINIMEILENVCKRKL